MFVSFSGGHGARRKVPAQLKNSMRPRCPMAPPGLPEKLEPTLQLRCPAAPPGLPRHLCTIRSETTMQPRCSAASPGLPRHLYTIRNCKATAMPGGTAGLTATSLHNRKLQSKRDARRHRRASRVFPRFHAFKIKAPPPYGGGDHPCI